MVNIICEYKHDKNWEGAKMRPWWLDEGGVWYDPDNYSYIGVVKDPEVKVPETVIRFTKKSFVERQLDVHSRHPLKKIKDEKIYPKHTPENLVEMTDDEVTKKAETWWDNNVNS